MLPEFNPAERPEGEVIPHLPPTNDRSLARRIALQILYEVDSARHPPGAVTAVHLQARQVSRKAARYVQRLVEGVMTHLASIDSAIGQFAPNFPIEQMSLIDRNILRLGIYELAVAAHIPVGVAIDEAVGLGRLYGADSTPGFINGVLGNLAEDPPTLRRLKNAAEPDIDDDAGEPDDEGADALFAPDAASDDDGDA